MKWVTASDGVDGEMLKEERGREGVSFYTWSEMRLPDTPDYVECQDKTRAVPRMWNIRATST